MNLLQGYGAATGILGALMVTSRSQDTRFVAFCIWILSNVFIAISYIELSAWPLLVMGSVYTLTSGFGAWNNRPWRGGLQK